MNITYERFHDLPGSAQHEIAEQVSAYTNGLLGEWPQMLPVTPDEVLAKDPAWAAHCGDDLAGYIGSFDPVMHDSKAMIELGTLWVPKTYQGNGIAHNLAQFVTKDAMIMGATPYVFCNSLSKPIFEQTGFLAVGCASIPPCALESCATCPMQPQVGCCDTMMVFGGAA